MRTLLWTIKWSNRYVVADSAIYATVADEV